MSFSRRTFLAGAGSSAVAVLLAACVPEPDLRPSPTPTSTAGRVPAPSAFARSAWTTDPFARGALSFDAVGTLPSDRATLARPIAGRVYFAGEAASAVEPGTIAGAWRSGVRVANEIAATGTRGERVAGVGAGIAGAEAAARLSADGFDVRVIEARERVGGRIHSANSDDWPLPVQFGGWRVAADDARVIADLSDAGLQTVTFGDGEYRATGSPPTVAVPTIGPESLATAIAWAADQQRDVPLSIALVESGARSQAANSGGDLNGAELLDSFLAELALDTGADPTELSSWYPPEPRTVDVGILDDLDALIATRLDGISTTRSTQVVGIAYNDDGVSLRLGTGESLSVDRVIVTVPIGVLQSGDIEFEPPLPFEHRSAIGAIGNGAIETVWLRFDEPFWSSEAVVWRLGGGDYEVRNWVNLAPTTGQPVLVGLVGGESALRVAELDDDELAQSALEALEAFVD